MPFNFRKPGKLRVGPIHRAAERTSLNECPFIDDGVREQLQRAGIAAIEDIPARTSDAAHCAALARETSLSEDALRRLASIAGLLEIPGLHPPLAELLVAAGVTSVSELGRREAGRLADALLAIQTERCGGELLPSAAVIEGWIAHARRSARSVMSR